MRTRFLYCCTGCYSDDAPHRPAFAGMDDFKGDLVLPQFWPPDLDYADKRVVVIGSGATAVTLVPALARTAAHVTMLQCTPSFILALPARDRLARWLQILLPRRLAYAAIRWKNVLAGALFHTVSRRCAMAFGYTNASWTLTAQYVCRLLAFVDRKGVQIAVPRREAGVVPQPFLNFTSGYVQRARHLLPAQGSRKPWQVCQNYLQDLLVIRYGRIDDGVMAFGTADYMK